MNETCTFDRPKINRIKVFFFSIYLCILYIIILIQKSILSNNARILKNHNFWIWRHILYSNVLYKSYFGAGYTIIKKYVSNNLKAISCWKYEVKSFFGIEDTGIKFKKGN